MEFLVLLLCAVEVGLVGQVDLALLFIMIIISMNSFLKEMGLTFLFFGLTIFFTGLMIFLFLFIVLLKLSFYS
jgi:hypothetical protein